LLEVGAGDVSGRIDHRTARPDVWVPPDQGDSKRDRNRKEHIAMGNKIDDAKGRAKEAAGDLTDNDRLKREGKTDQAGAKVKDFVDDVKDKVEDAVDNVKEKISKH
jgi:uncharacterized protein YjbJ (UPF0337 family)